MLIPVKLEKVGDVCERLSFQIAAGKNIIKLVFLLVGNIRFCFNERCSIRGKIIGIELSELDWMRGKSIQVC